MKTVNDIFLSLLERLKKAADPQPMLTAREITALATGADRAQTAQWAHRYIDEAVEQRVWQLYDRLCVGEPLAYLVGEWEFYGLPFSVGPEVLIPRADTEVLCEQTIAYLSKRAAPRILDLCCGSGCIGITLAHELSDAKVYAVDLSDEALALTRKNARRNGVHTRVLACKGNALLAPPAGMGEFDTIVSNPPYIAHDEIQTLQPSVRDYEPHLALDGGIDGLDFYRAILQNGWGELLRQGGRLWFECGATQTKQVAALLEQACFTQIAMIRDLAGNPRVVSGRK